MTFFPIGLCWPTSIIPMALYIDIVSSAEQELDRHRDCRLDGLLPPMYSNNWVILAPFHQASEQYGTLMSLADIIGFHYVRTSMPEIHQNYRTRHDAYLW